MSINIKITLVDFVKCENVSKLADMGWRHLVAAARCQQESEFCTTNTKNHTPNTAQKPNIKQHRPNTAQRLNTNTKNFTNTTIQTSNKQTKQQRQKTNTKTKPNNKHQTLHAQHLNIRASLQKVPNINRKQI